MDKIKPLIFGAAALALLAACTPARTEAPPVPAEPESAIVEATPEPTETATTPETTIDLPADSASEQWSDDMSLHRIKPLDVPLDAAAQWQIYSVCGYNDADFCLLMAIGYHETSGSYDRDAVGDGGGSIGIFQINVKWHRDRMERLDVTDLGDPAQCAAVALDYLKELEGRYGFEAYSEELLLSYNMGPDGARKAISKGITSTEYSRTVITLYEDFLAQLGG